MSKNFDENSRVKIPALIHLTRLGYDYVSLKQYKDKDDTDRFDANKIDIDTNIFIDLFHSAINRINNKKFSREEIKNLIAEISSTLSGADLGRAFYNILLDGYKGIKLIDFSSKDGAENDFNVVTELTYKNGSDEFRPDITILVNGMPLAFIEVKIPNNKEGIQAEYKRINIRFANEKFRKFVNITQFMVFSNNSEYDDTEAVPLSGAFYATTSYSKMFFSHFREEDNDIFKRIKPINTGTETFILKDKNLVTIKNTDEYKTNLNSTSPTNRIITSLYSHDRLMMLLKYGFAYVDTTNDNGILMHEKHMMRYPQFFATKAIENKLESGIKHGIIWHTQGSGKTELAYYNTKYLKDYFQKKSVIAKFFFIVDRIDLCNQAVGEFRDRGLVVNEITSKDIFVNAIRATGDKDNTGEDSITVVNIQKFSEESIAKQSDYNVNIQRIYFLDEAHRSYRPTGSFLANLIASDRNAVIIALTGTPLISKEYNSKDVFGNYIHKYYYNRSIADRYTLRLIREGITTTYVVRMRDALDQITTIKGGMNRKDLYAHPKYVKELVKYITDDFDKSKIACGDNTIGAMIVSDSSEQARAIFEEMKNYKYKYALILHDEDDKDTRRQERIDFKNGRLDFLIVFNMLLTGFNAPRLKKMYLGRVIKDHSLLQALTRVNRPYNSFRFGYVVDFADIRKEFDKTNKAYFDELQEELGDEFKQYDNIFKTPEEIQKDLKNIEVKLFMYNTTNAEKFSQQISAIDSKEELLEIQHALELYKDLFNVVKLFGYSQLADKFTLNKANSLYNEVSHRINTVNTKAMLSNMESMKEVLNIALTEVDFQFKCVSKQELVIADKLRETLERTRGVLVRTHDPKDPEYISLLEELQRLFAKKNLEELTADEMESTIKELDYIYKTAEQKNLHDQMIADKYTGDYKFMRIMPHDSIKDWTVGIAFVSTGGDCELQPTELNYLENMFYKDAKATNRFHVVNTVTPTLGINDNGVAIDMKNNLKGIKMMLGLLGYKVFEPVVKQNLSDTEIYMFVRNAGKDNECNGKMIIADDKFVLLKGALIEPKLATYVPKAYKKLRDDYKDYVDQQNHTTKDLTFVSPSAAAVYICGKNSNGRKEWVNKKTNIELGQYLDSSN